MSSTKVIRAVFVSLCGCLTAAPAFAAAPRFIEVGKVYNMPSYGGGQSLKVLEVDRESGWIKVQIESSKPEVIWLNTNQLPAIREGAAPAPAQLPPINFKK